MTETLLERIEQIRSLQSQLCALVQQTKVQLSFYVILGHLS